MVYELKNKNKNISMFNSKEMKFQSYDNQPKGLGTILDVDYDIGTRE